LYLAFIKVEAEMDVAIERVPTMACVMYTSSGIEIKSSQAPVMFGATLPYGTLKRLEDKELKGQKERARRWRRNNILIADLAKHSKALLPLSASALPDLERYLHRLIIGVPDPEAPEECPLYEGLENRASDIEQRLLNENADYATRKHDKLFGKNGTRQILQPLLRRIIQRRYELQTAPKSDPALLGYFQDVLRYYVKPHIFAKNGGVSEVPLTSEDEFAVEMIMNDLWGVADVRDRAFAKLEFLIDRHQEDDVPPLGTYGKCAETYPVVGVGYVTVCSIAYNQAHYEKLWNQFS
jgi:hypothetical protein